MPIPPWSKLPFGEQADEDDDLYPPRRATQVLRKVCTAMNTLYGRLKKMRIMSSKSFTIVVESEEGDMKLAVVAGRVERLEDLLDDVEESLLRERVVRREGCGFWLSVSAGLAPSDKRPA